jgi:hypothetical protein
VLIDLRHTYVVAKEKLFPGLTTNARDKREPHDRFSDFAAKIVAVPKSEIDKREKQWQRKRIKRAEPKSP